jgi:hypothetical protein
MESKRDLELVHQLLDHERDRVRFLLKAYLRTRLHKIEQFAGIPLRSAISSPAGAAFKARTALTAGICQQNMLHAGHGSATPLSGNCVLHRQACFIQEYPWRCSVRQ